MVVVCIGQWTQLVDVECLLLEVECEERGE